MVSGFRPAGDLRTLLGFRPHTSTGSPARPLHPEVFRDDEPAEKESWEEASGP
jgi:hypothetical protein